MNARVQQLQTPLSPWETLGPEGSPWAGRQLGVGKPFWRLHWAPNTNQNQVLSSSAQAQVGCANGGVVPFCNVCSLFCFCFELLPSCFPSSLLVLRLQTLPWLLGKGNFWVVACLPLALRVFVTLGSHFRNPPPPSCQSPWMQSPEVGGGGALSLCF